MVVAVLSQNDGCVTNAEARMMLMENVPKGRESENKSTDEVVKLALAYLDKQPAASQTPDGIRKCLRALRGIDGRKKDFKLKIEERIQLVNLAPSEEVLVHVICKDCDDRYDDDDVEEILRISNEFLQKKMTSTHDN